MARMPRVVVPSFPHLHVAAQVIAGTEQQARQLRKCEFFGCHPVIFSILSYPWLTMKAV